MKKFNLILLLIVGIAIFLRSYNINENYYFSGELGKEMLFLREIVETKTLPLTGMSTSHEWLKYGPFYYYFMLPIFILLKGNPFILFFSGLFISILGSMLNFWVFKRIANKRVAIISTFLQAVSPLLVWQTRLSKLHVFFFILMPIFSYLLYLVWNGNKKYVFWAGIVFGLMFSFHFSQIPLLGVVALLFIIKRKIYKLWDWIVFGIAVLIPNLTLLWHDRNLIVWLPYRILKYSGQDLIGTGNSFSEFWGTTLLWQKEFWVLGVAIFLVLFSHYIHIHKKKIKSDFLSFFLISTFGFVIMANSLHGVPPVHYFLPIFTLPAVLFAIYFDKFPKFLLLIIPIIILNFNFYFGFTKPEDFVPFAKQVEMASFIVNDAKNKELTIKRVGPYDYFPENYSQNYKYLVFWKGGRVTENAKNTYIITDPEGIITKK